MAKAAGWQAARRTAGPTSDFVASVAKGIGKKAGGKGTSVFGTIGKQIPGTYGKMPGGGSLKPLLSYMGKHKLGSAFVIYFLIQTVLKAMRGHTETFMQQGLQGQQIEGQMAANPEDIYYQAMLPQLSQQRQGAQNALMQAILSGSGQTMPVPGERIIGGG